MVVVQTRSKYLELKSCVLYITVQQISKVVTAILLSARLKDINFSSYIARFSQVTVVPKARNRTESLFTVGAYFMFVVYDSSKILSCVISVTNYS